MPALNRIQLIGYLGKDPETRYTPTGRKVCTFSLAVDRRWKNSAGETRQETDWFNIEAWGRLGETCQEYLHKGSLVYLEGRLRTEHYERQGERHQFTKVVLGGMQMLDRRKEEEPLTADETSTDYVDDEQE
jgi:single-strand DNA-binding protein